MTDHEIIIATARMLEDIDFAEDMTHLEKRLAHMLVDAGYLARMENATQGYFRTEKGSK